MEIKSKKIINETSKCFDNNGNVIKFNYEYNGILYESCKNGNLINNSNIKNCSCDLEKCSSCPIIVINEDLCLECNINNGYYMKENDTNKFGGYFNCYKDIEGYYLDRNDLLFKKCYEACDTCEIKGDNISHNCLRCNNNYTLEIGYNNYTNCYKSCKYYYYFDKNKNYHCTVNLSCPNDYPKLIQEKNECTQFNIKDMIQNINKLEILNETSDKKEEEKKYYDTILDTIESSITSEYFDTSDIDNGKEEIIETEKMKVTLTTTHNQKNNSNNNPQ